MKKFLVQTFLDKIIENDDKLLNSIGFQVLNLLRLVHNG